MADLASFRLFDSDRPSIVNLDRVTHIEVSESGMFGTEQVSIDFFFDLVNNRSRKWIFSGRAAPGDLTAQVELRDDVLNRLLNGERVFNINPEIK